MENTLAQWAIVAYMRPLFNAIKAEVMFAAIEACLVDVGLQHVAQADGAPLELCILRNTAAFCIFTLFNRLWVC